jgi:hypothetical protein
MNGLPGMNFRPPAFEIVSLIVPFEHAIALISLGILPFLFGWMFQQNRFQTSLCLIFTGIGLILALRYESLVEAAGHAHGVEDHEGTFRHLPLALAFEVPAFAFGLLVDFIIRSYRNRKSARGEE